MNKNSVQFSSSGSKSNSDLIDAKLEEHQTTQCPGCGHNLQSRPDWVGLPAGVKFDPTDQELIEHLHAKVEENGKQSNSHPLIDEFIPTIEGDDGICYTHPEKLPGVTRDGLSRHFFHRPSKAYTTGTRKRRKIQTECDLQGGETRWHKTGKTRPVMVNGKQKGCKKILVLYTNFGKNRKPEKTNWVMHQYHLGIHEEEKEGELVASKIFYQTQPRQCNWSERANNNASSSTTQGSGGGGGRGEHMINRRESTGGSGGGGSGSSSSREMIAPARDELSAAVGVAMSSYGSMDNIHQLKGEQFSYLRYRKSFDELTNMVSAAHPPEEEKGNQIIKVRMSETLIAREGGGATATATSEEEHHRQMAYHLTANEPPQQQHHHHHHQIATTSLSSFNISRPSLPISTIISPPPLHHSSVNILDDDDSFHVSTLLLQNQNFQQQQQQQQQHHHKLSVGGRVASGLEELIMGCTNTSTDDNVKDESSSNPNPQEMEEWLKYSTSFWPDSDNPDHHHG